MDMAFKTWCIIATNFTFSWLIIMSWFLQLVENGVEIEYKDLPVDSQMKPFYISNVFLCYMLTCCNDSTFQ